MHRWLLALALPLAGCGDKSDGDDTGSTDDDDDDGTVMACEHGWVSGIVWNDMEQVSGLPNAAVYAQQGAGDERIEFTADENGEFELGLVPGTWMLSAEDKGQNCYTDGSTEVLVIECETIDQDLVMDLWAG